MLCRDPISILHHFVTSHQQHCRENGHIDHSVADESLNVSRPIGQSHTRTCALTARLQCNEATSAVRPLWILHHDSIAEHTQTSVSSECIRCLGARMPPRLSSAGGSARATLRQLTSRDGNLTEEAIRMVISILPCCCTFRTPPCLLDQQAGALGAKTGLSGCVGHTTL